MATEQQSANLRSAMNLARFRTNLPPESELPASKFTYEQRIAYNKALAAIIAQYPDRFPPTSVEVAQDVVNKTYEPLQSQSMAESVKIFADEVANQAKDINATLNPLSEESRKKTASTLKWVIIALAVGSFAVYFGPALFSGGQRLRVRAGRRSTL